MTKQVEQITWIHAKQQHSLYLKGIWQRRELLYFFIWRDILVRYKQAIFGIAWAIIRPVITMLVFAWVFGALARFPSENINYGLFVLAGMVPWQMVATTCMDTSQCLIQNSQLITKIYFPRVILPVSSIALNSVDAFISLCFLLGVSIVWGEIDYSMLWALPLFIVLTGFLCLGLGFWLSALTLQYRDFRFLVMFVVQFGMFLSPVGYGTFMVPEKWQMLFFFNPMVGIIDGFRWALFGVSHPLMGSAVAISASITLLLFISGFYYFRKMEGLFADSI